MKATKIFMMAALALMTAACSNDEIDFAQQPAEQPANGEITITATLDSNDGATTRTLVPNGSNINSTWATTDEFAILFNDGTSNVKRTATVKSINGSNVTITFTIPESLANNTACTIVYPASAANAANTGADVATALATQNGAIATTPEVRVGTATIDKTNHNLTNVTKLAAQNAIFKFTIQNISETNKAATEFKVSDASGNVITTITPGTASGELFVALPVMAAGTYWFNATIDGKSYVAKATTAAATVAGKYYQTTVKMATIGDVILSDGKFYPSGTASAVAMIAYVGSSTGASSPYIHGLALALADEGRDESKYYADEYCSDNTPVANAIWTLPSKNQWETMIAAAGGYAALRGGFLSVGGTNLVADYYWSSTQGTKGSTWWWSINFDNGNWAEDSAYSKYVRACLVF